MPDRNAIPGKFVWFELVCRDTKKAQAFYGEVLGWKVQPFPMGNLTYEMILAGDTPDTMIGGYAAPSTDRQAAHWISYVSVPDVDAAVKTAVAKGGRVVEPPSEIPNVGRSARIADPQGAEICPFKNTSGDPPDGPVPPGRFLWNELHTTDPKSALSFYQDVFGFSHRAMDMGPAGTYFIIAGGGADRGGVSGHLAGGARPHWLPYVHVGEVDATIARAKRLGATIPMNPEDIPGVGRIATLQDPTGALLAIIRPNPRQG